MDVNKLRKKQNRFRCLKTISYLLGYPLFIVVAFLGALSIFTKDAFEATRYYSLLAAVVLWLISVIFQIVVCILTKSYNGRTLCMLLVSLIVLIGGSVVFDLYAAKKINEIDAKYTARAQEHGIDSLGLPNYKYQAGWITTWTSGRTGVAEGYANDVDDFLRVYNIGFKSSCFDSEHNPDKSVVTYNEEEDAYYSPNGLYADGYVFGFKSATDVLITYYETKFDLEHKKVETTDANGKKVETYVKNGKNADELLAAAEKELQTNPNSAWNKYKKTDEYKAAYGENGSAYKFMLNEERLETLVASLAKGLKTTQLITGLENNKIFGGIIKSLLQKYLHKTGEDLNELDLQGACDLINGLGLFEDEVNPETILGLLEGLYFYQSPQAKPIFAFIEDETLRAYAYADYHGRVHGTNMGSVLIPNGDGNIGHVTMSTGGYPQSFGASLYSLYRLRAQEEMSIYYPLMITRKYAYIFGGIVAFTTVLYYVFKRKEDEVFAQIVG